MAQPFQSTRLREARRQMVSAQEILTGFNPRACGRRDICSIAYLTPAISFNPRACGRRDRSHEVKIRPPEGEWFQSTRLREARRFEMITRPYWSKFQSTRLREARHHHLLKSLLFLCFNPRACGRRDDLHGGIKASCRVSIHAPAGGAT